VRDNVENPQAILQVAEAMQIDKDEKIDFFVVEEPETAQAPTQKPARMAWEDDSDGILLSPPILDEPIRPIEVKPDLVAEAEDLSEGLLGPDF
jgi:hypothetical protein